MSLALALEIEVAHDPAIAHRMGLPRDNRARLAMQGRRLGLRRLMNNAMHAEVADAMRIPGRPVDDTLPARRRARLEGLAATIQAAATTTEAELAAEVEALGQLAAEHHRLLTDLARDLESDPADPQAGSTDLSELAPIHPPGPELVALSLAPHAPPAELCLHTTPAGVT